MFDQILQLVREQATELLSASASLPASQHEAVANEAGESIQETIKEKVGQGKLTELMDLMKGNTGMENSVTASAVENLAGRLTSNHGMGTELARSVSESLIPGLMKQFVQKATDPNDDSINIKGMISQLTGGSFNMGSVLGMMGGLFGKGLK